MVRLWRRHPWLVVGVVTGLGWAWAAFGTATSATDTNWRTVVHSLTFIEKALMVALFVSAALYLGIAVVFVALAYCVARRCYSARTPRQFQAHESHELGRRDYGKEGPGGVGAWLTRRR